MRRNLLRCDEPSTLHGLINAYSCPAGDMTERASNMLQQAASATGALQANGPVDKETEISIAKYYILRAGMVPLYMTSRFQCAKR